MDIKSQTTGELRNRLMLGKFIVGQIKDDPDPRTPAAIENLVDQMKQIQQELQKRLEGKPEPQVVGLKPLTLKARGVR